MSEPLPLAGLHFERSEHAVRVWSDAPLAVVSSAIVGADLRAARQIVNLRVPKDYNGSQPAQDLAAYAARSGIAEPFVGMMTAARTENARVAVEADRGVTVIAVVTVGLSRPTAAGVSPAAEERTGTINTILLIDAALAPAAMINAVITATEAKTLALVESNTRTPGGELASGTATDSIVIATTGRGALVEYAGPVSPIGALIGRAVRRAMLSVPS